MATLLVTKLKTILVEYVDCSFPLPHTRLHMLSKKATCHHPPQNYMDWRKICRLKNWTIENKGTFCRLVSSLTKCMHTSSITSKLLYIELKQISNPTTASKNLSLISNLSIILCNAYTHCLPKTRKHHRFTETYVPPAKTCLPYVKLVLLTVRFRKANQPEGIRI